MLSSSVVLPAPLARPKRHCAPSSSPPFGPPGFCMDVGPPCPCESCSRRAPALATGKRQRGVRWPATSVQATVTNGRCARRPVERQLRPSHRCRRRCLAIAAQHADGDHGEVVMRCGDLERYLEAFLDGRLGRSRSSVLRRHVALCGSCQARIERLRQFERDTQRRFRALEQPVSVWEGLELDLVGSGGAVGGRLLASRRSLVAGPDPGPREEPPPRRALHHPLVAARLSARGGASRLVGLVLVAMALGATYQLARAGLEVEGESDAAEAYLGFTPGRRRADAAERRSPKGRRVAGFRARPAGGRSVTTGWLPPRWCESGIVRRCGRGCGRLRRWRRDERGARGALCAPRPGQAQRGRRRRTDQ